MRIGVLLFTVAALIPALRPYSGAAADQEARMVSSADVDSILKQLADSRRTIRDTARAALRGMEGKIISVDLVRLLRAAGQPFPKEDGEDDTAVKLIVACSSDPALVPVALEVF